jgi:hypothetical protein
VDESKEYYFYGSMVAFLSLGFFTDFLAKGKNVYTLLACVIVFQILSSLTGLIYYIIDKEKITELGLIVGIYGWIVCIGVVL